MTFLADKIPMWLTAVLATIGLACTVTAILCLIAVIYRDWVREDREAAQIRRMNLRPTEEYEVLSWTGRKQLARWQ